MTITLKITQDTVLKKRPIQSTELNKDEKYSVKAGTELAVLAYKSAGNHLLVTFKSSLGAFNTYYVFGKHCQVIDSNASSVKHLSTNGIYLIQSFEGCRLAAYLCPAGVWTIGWGETSGVYPGQTITQAQADSMFLQSLVQYENAVRSLVEVSLTQAQYDSLVSFCYNCGIGALGSSSLLRVLNSGDYQSAADQFLRWTNGGLEGLVRRRDCERAMFLGGNWRQYL